MVKGILEKSTENQMHLLAHRVVNSVRNHFPIRGKIVTVKDNKAEINLGLYHGVKKGMELEIRRPRVASTGNIQPEISKIGKAFVADVNKFDAAIEIKDVEETITTGMLVLEKKNRLK